MTKNKKTNILKKIILTLTACFIAVFSVFTLVDIPKEVKQVSAATIADGDIVYSSSPSYNLSYLTQSVPSSDFNSFNAKINSYFFSFKFVYSSDTNIVDLDIILRFPYLMFYPSTTNTVINRSNGVDFSYTFGNLYTANSYSLNLKFNALYSMVFDFKSFVGSGTPSDSAYSWFFFTIDYVYDSSNPFAFDKLTIYTDPTGANTSLGDMRSVFGSYVTEYTPLLGNTSRLSFINTGFANIVDTLGGNFSNTYYLKPNYESSTGGSSDPNAYQNGYDNGYARGYIEGESSAQDSFFDRGYNEGYDSGKADGYLEGEQAGISQGNTSGYLRGKNDGYREGKEAALNDSDKYSFTSLITSAIDVPINAFRSLFNFEVLGVDLSGFFLGLLTCCIVITIVKMII